MAAGVQRQEGVWTDPASTRRLFYRCWSPDAAGQTVMLIHGFGEHSGRYDAFAQALADYRITVICPDLWGHGRSAGPRGDIERFAQYVDDLHGLATQGPAGRLGGRGLAVFGHSIGGLVALHWALRRPAYLRCLIVQSPLLEIGFPIPPWKLWLAARATAWWPRLGLPGGMNPAWLSHDRAIVDAYRHDPLVHDRVTLRAYAEIRRAMAQATDQAAQLAVPTLWLYAEEDRVVSVEACRRAADRLTCERRVLGFPNVYHELHHEAIARQVILEVAGWVRQHA